jgi:hypothetical protein
MTLPFLDGRLPPAFVLRVIVVAPGRRRRYEASEWRDALVVVAGGAIDLEPGRDRAAGRFERGDVLSLAGLPLHALHNRGREPAVLIAVTRRR